MNRFNPTKLHLSKWTATVVHNKEKHFLVVELDHDEQGILQRVDLEAIHSGRIQTLDWQDLRDKQRWQMGWL